MNSATPAAPPERTEAQVMKEMAELTVKLTLLEFELKRIRNPNGLTFADLRGVFAGPDLGTNEIDAARAGGSAKLDVGLQGTR